MGMIERASREENMTNVISLLCPNHFFITRSQELIGWEREAKEDVSSCPHTAVLVFMHAILVYIGRGLHT